MAKKRKISKRLRKFSIETRLKSSNKFKDKILGMFKGYIKAVIVWGSISRGDFTGKSDVDLYIIFDDTKMPLKKFDEIRARVDQDIYKIARSIDPRLHPQPVLALTEFWDGIRHAHPLFYNIVREGYAIHDTGFFIPMRKLLEWGKFPATAEAAELRISTVPKRILRVKNVKSLMIAEDLYYAVTDSAQAVLMYLGIGPPAPKVLAREVRKHLVGNKLLDEKYAKFIDNIMIFRKGIEHRENKKTISGKDLDKWIERTEDYVKTMHQLLKRLEINKKANDVDKNYEVMVKASVAALKAINKLPPEPKNLPKAFHKYLIETGLINPMYGEVFGKVVEMRKMLQEKKLQVISDRDVYMSKEYVRRFLMDIRRVIDRGKDIDIDDLLKRRQAEAKMAKAEKEVAEAKEIKKIEKPKKKKTKKKKK